MQTCVIATFFTTLKAAEKCVAEREKNRGAKMKIVAHKNGFYVISLAALKKSGVVPSHELI